MEINIKVNIAPFEVPSAVKIIGTRADGIHGSQSQTINLDQIDEYTLEKLCDDFRTNVFKNAGKARPPQCVQG